MLKVGEVAQVMPDVVLQGLQLLWAALLLLALAVCVEVVTAFVLGSLRLVDWFMSVVVAAAFVAIPAWLWAISPWALLGLPLALWGGVMMGRSAVARWRSDAASPVVGYYVIGRPPDGVVNWITR